ncbi:MAG: hypothetical protein ABEJ87_01270 [Candidatus Nanohalobium sp.]
MSTGDQFDFGPGYFEELSDYSNQDLRLTPEYTEIEEDFRKIKSFRDAVQLLENSDEAYHRSAKAVGSAWPEAYDAFVSMDDALGDVSEKIIGEKVMNSGFQDFHEEEGEVMTRYRELQNAIENAKQMYRQAAASLAVQIKSAALRGQKTPLEYAETVSDSEVFDGRAEELDKYVVRPDDSTGERVWKILDQTDAS